MLNDRNDNPTKLFNGRVEWPIALLFSAIPALVLLAVVKNVILA